MPNAPAQKAAYRAISLVSRALARTIAGTLLGAAAVLVSASDVANLQAQAEEPFPNGRLWRVERGDKPPSYLFGTLHLPDPAVESMPDTVGALVASADSLSLELHPDMMGTLAAQSVARPGPNLQSVLDDAMMAEIIDMASEYGLPPWAVRTMPAWTLLSLLSVPPDVIDRMLSGYEGVDMQLASAAADHDVRVFGLETLEEQLALIDGMDDQSLIAAAADLIDNREVRDQVYRKMVRAYVSGNILSYFQASIRPYAEQASDSTEPFLDALIYDRNLIMVERMMPRLNEGNALVAVGAMHLPGDDGILDLLDEQGFAVTPIPLPGEAARP